MLRGLLDHPRLRLACGHRRRDGGEDVPGRDRRLQAPGSRRPRAPRTRRAARVGHRRSGRWSWSPSPARAESRGRARAPRRRTSRRSAGGRTAGRRSTIRRRPPPRDAGPGRAPATCSAPRHPHYEVEGRRLRAHRPSGRMPAWAATPASVGGRRPLRTRQAIARNATMVRPRGSSSKPSSRCTRIAAMPSMAPHTQRTTSVLQTVRPEAWRRSATWSSLPATSAGRAGGGRHEEGQLEEKDAHREHHRRELGEGVAPPDCLERQRGEQEADEVAARVPEEDRGLGRIQEEEADAGPCSEIAASPSGGVDRRQGQERDRRQARDEAVADVGQVDRVDDDDDPGERDHGVEERLAGEVDRDPSATTAAAPAHWSRSFGSTESLSTSSSTPIARKSAPPRANSKPTGSRSTTSAPIRNPKATAIPPSVATGCVCAGMSGSGASTKPIRGSLPELRWLRGRRRARRARSRARWPRSCRRRARSG